MIDYKIIGEKPHSFKTLKKINSIINIVFCIIFIPIIFINVCMLFQSFFNQNKVPEFFGYRSFIITSGSMEPILKKGDYIIIKHSNLNKINVGDIITFKQGNTMITHRVVEIVYNNENNNLQFRTKGDYNNVSDSELVTADNIQGKYINTVPFLGNIILFIQKPYGLIILFGIPILVILLNFKMNQINKLKIMERKNKRKLYEKNV